MKVEGAIGKQRSHSLDGLSIQTMSDLCEKELSSDTC